jgi:hypothetical protein
VTGRLRAALAPLAVLPLLAQPPAAQTSGTPWDWLIGRPPGPVAEAEVTVPLLGLDPDAVTAADIARLRGRGVLAICYVSVGTLEDWRADAAAFPSEVLGAAYAGWPGERFLDIRRLDLLLPLMEARFRRCAEAGFGAVEPDNIDLHINDTGFPIAAEDVLAYVRALAQTAHGLGLRIAQKNAPDLAAALAPQLDFAMTENCLADGWCAAMAPYGRAGKAVLAAEYDVPRDRRAALCDRAPAAGLSLLFVDRSLDRPGARCD